MARQGTRDGSFIVFKDTDINSFDIAYYPKLKNNTASLKAVALAQPGFYVYAFNTNGWVKSLADMDWKKFTTVRGCDLYVRVEFPGFYFAQQQDSIGNDVDNIGDGRNVLALIGRLARIFEDKSNEPEIAAFNTKGQVKSKVVYPLAKGPGQSPSVLDGIYIRTEFRSYNFFPGVDSPGSDLLQISGAINQLPALIQETEGRDNASGFNTNGWIKTKLTIPPTEKPSSFTLPTQGTYARVGWSDFVYFPGLDSPLGDIKQLQGKQIWELVDAARKDSSVLAFNTNGWLKNKLVPEPVEVTSSQPFLYGLYIKLVADDETRSLDQAFFLLKATAMIWAKGILVSTQVREGYQKAISAACQEIQDKVDASREAPWDGASTAENARSQYLLAMRRGGTSAGIFAIARGLKLYGGSYLSFLNSSALELYKKKFADLSLTESQLVTTKVINLAGRANPKPPSILDDLDRILKATTVIAVAFSIYQVSVANEWKDQLRSQVLTWCGPIAAGFVDSGVGTLVGPIGAILGGICGGIIGSPQGGGNDPWLSNWFYGGSSSATAAEMLGASLSQARDVVIESIKQSNAQFVIHQVRKSQLSKISNDSSQAKSAVQSMVNSPLGGQISDGSDEVIGTLVWVKSKADTLPLNGGNPKDLATLLDWAVKNLPSSSPAPDPTVAIEIW